MPPNPIPQREILDPPVKYFKAQFIITTITKTLNSSKSFFALCSPMWDLESLMVHKQRIVVTEPIQVSWNE